MFVKGKMVYADAYKYLKHKEKNIVALSIKGSADDWSEVAMTAPISVKTTSSMVTWENGLLACMPEEFTYEGVKTRIIKSRYSTDDQLAIVFNKDKDEENALYYSRMQEWRNFAGEIARLAEDSI